MIPGEIIPAKGVVTLNEGRDAIIINVANTGDRHTGRQSLSLC